MKKLCFVLLLVLGCGIFLDSVRQPSVVGPGEKFTITVTGTFDYNGTGWLGIMLPNGVRVDSVRYAASDGDTALLTEMDSTLCVWLTDFCLCEPDMHWVGFSFYREAIVDSFISYVALVYAKVTDSVVPAEYLVDYRSGHDPEYVYMTDSILDQPLQVTATGIAREPCSGKAVAGRVWPSVFHERLSIAVPEPDDIGVYDAGGRLVRTMRVEHTGTWDGTDESGRRMPAGAYLVRGKQTLSRVTLVD